jgi:AraC family transcriptional regulator
MNAAPTLITKALHKSTMVVTELKYDLPNFGMTAPIPTEDAYLIALQLRPSLDQDLYFEGRFVRPSNWFSGALTIYDLRQRPIADIRDPYHSLVFHLPRKALDSIAYESGARWVGDLCYNSGVGIDDPIARHLLSSLLPAMDRPGEVSALFLDHVALALTAHMAHVYGGINNARQTVRSGLAPHQERRAKEHMVACLNGNISLADLAEECGLSARHFSRAFRQSTGLSPHRWMSQHRIERARELLTQARLSLTEISLICGFADQSHFTRVFTAFVGTSPGAWRRKVRSSAKYRQM